jgi:hypothetical protein
MANKYAQFSKAPRRPKRGRPIDIIRFRKCAMKQTYSTEAEAANHASAQEFGMRAYRCSFCKKYHLTSKAKT